MSSWAVGAAYGVAEQSPAPRRCAEDRQLGELLRHALADQRRDDSHAARQWPVLSDARCPRDPAQPAHGKPCRQRHRHSHLWMLSPAAATTPSPACGQHAPDQHSEGGSSPSPAQPPAAKRGRYTEDPMTQVSELNSATVMKPVERPSCQQEWRLRIPGRVGVGGGGSRRRVNSSRAPHANFAIRRHDEAPHPAFEILGLDDVPDPCDEHLPAWIGQPRQEQSVSGCPEQRSGYPKSPGPE